MATYAYRGRTTAGAVNGEVEAADRTTAVSQLRSKGIVVTAVQERKARAAARPRRLGGKVKERELVVFTRQFSAMVDAGLPIAQCLTILAEQSDSKNLRDVTTQIAREVEAGGTLADSFRKFPRIFNELFTNMLQAGEAAGVLDVVLQRLSTYIEKAASLKRKVKGALVYPLTIVSVAILVVIFMMTF
ncbi:MAG TPA: type II secretion system F family protein, partial [Gemmatimonadales bacterium]|nr:type II secretion system F family protein [Gemmatimonadales bacterium]